MTSLDGINGRSIQTLLRGENDSKQSDEFQANYDDDYEYDYDYYVHTYGYDLWLQIMIMIMITIIRLSLIVRLNVVLNRIFVVDSDWRFDNLCGSHLQSQSELYHVSWWYYTLVIDLID